MGFGCLRSFPASRKSHSNHYFGILSWHLEDDFTVRQSCPTGSRRVRHELAPKIEELAVPCEHLFIYLPSQFRALESFRILRVRRFFPGEIFKFLFASIDHRLLQVLVSIVGEELKGRGLGVLFTHKQQRCLWREK